MYIQHINGEWKELYGDVLFSDTVYQKAETLSEEQRFQFNVYRMIDAPRPELDNLHKYSNPIYTLLSSGEVERSYEILEKTQEDLDLEAEINSQRIDFQRQEAYRSESDPLFFKWQRGEATKEEWLAKVDEIRNRYTT